MKRRSEKTSFGVIGLGRFGTALAKYLAEAGKEVVIIDCNEDKVRQLKQYTEHAFVADNLDKETLQEIGIHNCDTVIICIGEKIDTSILTTLNVVGLGVPNVIAKAISSDQGTVLEKIGAKVVYPERDMALRLGKRLVSNSFLDYISLDNQVEICQIKVTDKLVGLSVQKLHVRQEYGLNIIAVERNKVTDIEISPDYMFEREDVMVVIGKIDNIKRFENDIS